MGALRRAPGPADTALVMPIEFWKLIWVALLAYLPFGEVPDRFTWLGGTLVFGSVLYIACRGRRLAQTAPPGRGPMLP